jgi:ABC-type uncharacterized transport system substrate-binding protein
MSRKVTVTILFLCAALFLGGVLFYTMMKGGDDRTDPIMNHGEKWRIGYYEGGPYINYTLYLRAVTKGLVKIGWIEDIVIPEFPDTEDSKMLWDYLSKNVKSEYIQFVSDAYWSANWSKETREREKEIALKRLSLEKDIDLVIAMGTWAGQDLANTMHSVPTIILSTSDPVGAGIVKSNEKPGFDHILARCAPERYVRQMRLFHDIFGFKRIGVAFEDSKDGRIYANVEDLNKVAKQRGFEIIECHARDIGLTEEECRQEIVRCYGELAPQIDALWIGLHRGESVKFMPEILRPLFEHKVPTWYQEGSKGARRGALLSIAMKNYVPVGEWAAAMMARIFHGARPGELNQIYETPNEVAINLETAKIIGFDPPPGIMSAADEIYDRIEQ